MTFSIAARCEATGMFGVAVSSSSPAVAARCAHGRAGVGAVASQNVTDPSLGPRALDLLERGATADEAIKILVRNSDHIAYRQITIVDAAGNAAIHSGAQTLGRWTEVAEKNVACAGNLLANLEVPRAMADTFAATEGHLGDRLIAAMRAAITAGGEEGPVHSAGMRLVDKVPWPVADLRVDWSQSCPIERLAEIWEIYKPQLDDYVTRALNPSDAPSYGVPGDA